MPDLTILPLATEAEASQCAQLMATSEPWLTLGRGYEASFAILMDPARERYVARRDSSLAGFLILNMKGAFVGYVQTVCVAPGFRNRGVGTRLIGFAEDRIFAEVPNVFMCVSSFNPAAQRLYMRLGYEVVGELSDYIVRGHSETLLRKTLGPIATFRPDRRSGGGP